MAMKNQGEAEEKPTTTLEGHSKFEGGIWGLVIIISAFMIQFLVFGSTASIGVYNIELLAYFNDDVVGVSLIAALNFGIFLGSGPFVSLLMNRFSFRQISLCGSILVVIGLIAMPLLPYIPAMCISFGLLSGFGSCCVYIPSHVLSGMYYDKYRSLATGVATSGSGLGTAIMPVVVGTLIDQYAWKGSFIVLAGLCLHLFVFSALLRMPPMPPLPNMEEVVLPKDHDVDEDKLCKSSNGDCAQSSLLIKNVSETKEPKNKYMKNLKNNDKFIGSLDLNDLKYMDSWKSEAGFSNNEKIEQNHETSLTIKNEDNHSDQTDSKIICDTRYEGDQQLCLPLTCENDQSSVENTPILQTEDHKVLNEESSDEVAKSAIPKTARHFYVFTDYNFNIYFINNILWNMSISVIQSFAPEFLRRRGLSPMQSAWVFGSYGIGCFIGGILGGVGGNFKCINRSGYFTVANFLLGILICLLPLCESIAQYIVLLGISGLGFGIILGLLIVILTDLIGIESLGNGLCYLMLANGIGTFSGPPLAGKIQEDTGGFEASFYFSGSLSILAGLIFLLIPLRRFVNNQRKK